MWKITFRELKDRKWSLLAFCLGSFLMLWLYAATFKSSLNSTQQLQELVKTYPKGLLSAIGLSDLNIDTIEKYLNAKHFSLLWPLMAIILALSRAGNQFAGEIQSGTIGLLLALPLKRLQIFIAKYAAGLLTILCFTAVSVFGVIPLANVYNIPTHPGVLLGAWILTSLFMWAIYSFSLAVSVWVNEKGSVYGITSAFLILNYVTYIMSLVSDKLVEMKHFSLFYYFDTQQVLTSGHIPLRTLAVFCTAIIVTTFTAAWLFRKRDIYV